MIESKNENQLMYIDQLILVERNFNPDTYIVRLIVGGNFFDSPELNAEQALRTFKYIEGCMNGRLYE